jgi:hypothetical protein
VLENEGSDKEDPRCCLAASPSLAAPLVALALVTPPPASAADAAEVFKKKCTPAAARRASRTRCWPSRASAASRTPSGRRRTSPILPAHTLEHTLDHAVRLQAVDPVVQAPDHDPVGFQQLALVAVDGVAVEPLDVVAVVVEGRLVRDYEVRPEGDRAVAAPTATVSSTAT